ncbi:MAG: nitroreductase family protein, partial [Spirochaetia bacterium]
MKRIYLIPLFALMTSVLFAQDITLSKPPAKLGMDVLDAIRVRSAARAFVKKDIPVADLSTIVWAGNGLKGTTDAVSAASKAGATIPVSGDVDYVNLYVLTAKGAYLYDQQANVLKNVSTKDVRAEVTPEAIPEAALMILFAVDNSKAPAFLKKMPALFLQMANGTAGYGAQNIALVAAGLKISSVVMYN